MEENNAILLRINEQIFPTLIRKLHTTKNRFMYGFSIPQDIGKNLVTKSDIDIEFLSKNLVKENNKNFGNILYLPKILPRKTMRNKNFYIFDLNDKILILIYSTGNKPYVLPKYIPLTRNSYDILELFGGYLCEGFKARKINNHMDRLSYSSSEIDQIEWFINSMENLFEIKKSEWNAQILSSNKTKGFQDSLKEYWSSIGLQKDKIKVINNGIVNDKYGVCLVNIYNSTLAETVYEIFRYCKKVALKNKENSLKFFRGLSRGDIGVSVNYNRNILTFTTNTKENMEFFQKICGNLGIRNGKVIHDKRGKNGCWKIAVQDFKSYYNIVKLNAIAHQRRKNYFYSKFLKSKGNIVLKYLNAVSDGYNTSVKVSEHTNLSIFTTRTLLLRYKKMGLLNGKNKRDDKGTHQVFYSLSEKGQKLLDFYKDIENEITNNNI